MTIPLTERQQREFDYHRERAAGAQQRILDAPFAWGVLRDPGRQWWNAYWQMYAHLLTCDLEGRRVLVVGCGFGDDALRLSRLGARVSAFDLSPDALRIAAALAAREGESIDFGEMPAERMRYADSTFDCIVARDILHHVDIPATMREIRRVAKPDALFVVNEIYSHSITETLRRSRWVERTVYPRMRRFIYGTDRPYITDDERKLDESDVAEIRKALHEPHFVRHYNFVVTRLVPDRFDFLTKLDQRLLRALRPLAPWLAGRVLFSARIRK